ncbi:MAG: TraR/DksA family transcriptional regulator [Candidatus Binatus sp.]
MIMNRTYNTQPRATGVSSQHSASLTIVRTAPRDEVMRRLLIDLRDLELRKIRTLDNDEAVLDTQVPADELDQARRNVDLEFHATLLDLSESRLAAITSTLIRLDEGRFGVCEECNEQISLTRLQSVPFARNCFDCQKKLEAAARRARSRIVAAASPMNLFEPYQPEAERNEGIGVPPPRRRQL